MYQRVIRLPAICATVTLGQYVAAIRLANENPNAEFKHGLTTWWPTTGAEIMRQFRQGIHERINDKIPYARRGFKAKPLTIYLMQKKNVDMLN